MAFALCSQWDVAPPSLWLVAVVIALPHLFYVFLWTNPSVWESVFKRNSVKRFTQLAVAGKGVQFGALMLWFATRRPHGLCLDVTNLHFSATAIGLLLAIFGQVLNISVYKTIGEVGVYYGCRLGHKVPWVYGFPFNMVSHPQYAGSVLTVWGSLFIAHSQCPSGGVLLATWWTVLYAVNALVENFL